MLNYFDLIEENLGTSTHCATSGTGHTNVTSCAESVCLHYWVVFCLLFSWYTVVSLSRGVSVQRVRGRENLPPYSCLEERLNCHTWLSGSKSSRAIESNFIIWKEGTGFFFVGEKKPIEWPLQRLGIFRSLNLKRKWPHSHE